MVEEGEKRPEGQSTLVSRNITVVGRRTSVRLEPEMWTALREIARRESCKIHDICSLIQMRKNPDTSLTAAIRVFLMLYYRAASTEEGHIRAGHGSFQNMIRRARMGEDYARIQAACQQARQAPELEMGGAVLTA
jgi:predicted DNA-binding ribbon-helix-helix protein